MALAIALVMLIGIPGSMRAAGAEETRGTASAGYYLVGSMNGWAVNADEDYAIGTLTVKNDTTGETIAATLKTQDGGIRKSFTVRRMSYGIGVERTFPYHSPRTGRIEVVRHGVVRRAKLFYLRERSGKAAKFRERIDEKK